MSNFTRQKWWVDKIISGGQTGVDRAALDAAMELGIPHGGWCPKGRRAEDGPISIQYLLDELDSDQYSDRTKRNVLDSDATLVLHTNLLRGGTYLTWQFAEQQKKPCLKIRLTHPGRKQRVRDWLIENQVRTLNVAGPRASKEPEIYNRAMEYLLTIFSEV